MIWDKKEKVRRPLIIPSIMLILGILLEDWICRLYVVQEHPILGLIPIIGCFSFILMGKSDARQKLMVAFLAAGVLSMYASTISLDWSRSFFASEDVIKGRIVRIERLDDRIEMIISAEEGHILANVYESDSEIIGWGDLGRGIELVMELEKPNTAGNPGGFDYRNYLYGRGIYAHGSIKGSDIKSVDGESMLLYRLTSRLIVARESFLHRAFIDEDARELAGGILFGMGRNISDDVRTDFMEGGVGHILAVSGLHIGILYSIYKAAEKKLKIKNIIARKGLVVLLFVIYGTASLWSVSVTRAVLLILIKEFADMFDLRFDGVTALALVSDMMLVFRPYLVFSTGFQMSFLAIIGIVFMRPKIMYVLKRIETKYNRASSANDEKLSALATMVAVQILMIPYTVYVYNRFAILVLLNNWIMIALAGVYVPLGTGIFFVDALSSWIPLIANFSSFAVNYIGASLTMLGKGMVLINKSMLLGGNAVIRIVSPRIHWLVGIIAAVLYSASEEYKVKKKRNQRSARLKMTALAIASTIFTFVIAFNPVELADEVFLDVGQGDSLHIDWGEVDILIDGGGNVNYNVGAKTLKPYLLHTGTESLDLAISTHQHTDHFLGIEQLAEVYPIEEIIAYGTAGDRIVLDEERYIEILWPIPGYEDSDDENYYSRIFKVHDRGVTILVTGDITEDGEKALINHYRNGELRSHILKIAHHGSRFSTCSEFVDAVSPVIAVISVGKNNYGHPAPSVIEKLQSKGIIVYRTDIDGAIGIIIGDGKFFVCGNRRNMRIEEYRAN